MMRGPQRSLGLFNTVVVVIFFFQLLIFINCATVCPELLKNCFNLNQPSTVGLEDVESRISRLERRFRAMEQPGLLIDKFFKYFIVIIYLGYSLADSRMARRLGNLC